ncbi:SGNH/GDSL hydrolase family protein [Umezawaea sp. NPDC059074]|uniref:SGNH/GDSL hydrolase family protein n=1 Tax=Umezawaea sp. NPDC059074 TaxID=3346716 RepID=UPI0036C577F8
MGIATALVLSMVLVPAPVASDYVALGDSYAAGVGTGGTGAGCGRSPYSYPDMYRDAHGYTSFQFPACAGATIPEVLDRQVSVLSTETGLVTITVGGNDVGFTDVMTTCSVGSDRSCAKAVDEAKGLMRTELPGRYAKLFAAVSDRAPGAKVVLLGYPRLFEEKACSGGLTAAKRTAVNEGADLLADVMSAAATAASATFVDVRTPFLGHGVCADEPWVNPLTTPTADSYHPNKSGQVGYLRALEAALEPLATTQPVAP